MISNYVVNFGAGTLAARSIPRTSLPQLETNRVSTSGKKESIIVLWLSAEPAPRYDGCSGDSCDFGMEFRDNMFSPRVAATTLLPKADKINATKGKGDGFTGENSRPSRLNPGFQLCLQSARDCCANSTPMRAMPAFDWLSADEKPIVTLWR
jgi:hypothetical protein